MDIFEEKKIHISVLEYGAVGNGVADDTEAFIEAIEKSNQTKIPVYVPYGHYRIKKPLILKGSSITGFSTGAFAADVHQLPTLIIDQFDESAFVLEASSMSGIMFSYDYEDAKLGIKEMPPTIHVLGAGCVISHVKMYNVYTGIYCDDTDLYKKGNCGRINIEDVFIMNAHKTGIYVGGTLDASCLRNIEIWSPDSTLFPKVGVGIHFAKNDGMRMSDCFVFNADIGFLFDERHEADCFNGGTLCQMANCYVDFSNYGIVIRGRSNYEGDVHYYATQLTCTGGHYWCHKGSLVVESGDTKSTFVATEFRSNGEPNVVIKSGHAIVISGCLLERVFYYFEDIENIQINGGENIIINGNFIEANKNCIVINEKPGSLNVSGNTLKPNGGSAIIDKTDGDYKKSTDSNLIV